MDRKVVLLASGGMSHRFWSLKELEEHEASDPSHIITPEARAADEQRIAWMEAGDHAAIVDHMDDYMAHAPEGGFGHVLMMQAAVYDQTGRGAQAEALRTEALGWARYGFGSDALVRERALEVAALAEPRAGG